MKKLMIIAVLALPLVVQAEKKYVVQNRPYEERVEEAKRIYEQLEQDPTLLLRLELSYPPPEEVKKYDAYHLAASAELLAVMETAWDTKAKYTEDILMKFLDRLDWEEVDSVVIAFLLRKELSAAARRKLAPRVEGLIGKAKRYQLMMFYKNPQTPRDVVESALAHPKAKEDDLMIEMLNDRLKLYPAP